jgi:RNA polymerase sigma-19 factor, ECF subfamily
MSEHTKSFVVRLFDRHHGGLMRYLTARVHSAHDARDIAQETYLRLLQLDQVDFIRDPQSYLFRIASNLSRDTPLRR